MSVVQSAISSIRRKAGEIFNDDQGWFRGGKFTPVKQVESYIPGGFEGAKQRLQQTSWKEYTPMSMGPTAVKSSQYLGAALGNQQAGEDVGYFLKGVTKLTPWGMASKQFNKEQEALVAPTTQRQQTAERIGKAVYGTALTAPLGGANYLANVGSRALQGIALGTGINTVKNIVKGNNLTEGLGESAMGGLENSWQLAFTNLAADKIAGAIPALRSLTPESMKTGSTLLKNAVSMGSKETAKKLFTHNALKIFERALLETPIENTWFTAMNKLSGDEKRKFAEAWIQDIAGTAVGNLAFAGLNVGKQGIIDLNKPQIDEVGKSIYNTAKRYFGGSKESQAGFFAGEAAVGFPQAEGKFSNMADKKVRFEIDDSKAKLKITSPKEISKVEDDFPLGTSLSDILDHPKLFKQYPELKDTPVFYDKYTDTIGSFNGGQINLGKKAFNNLDETKSTLLHEIQHSIQQTEGFATGGNPNSSLGSLGKISDEEYRGALGNIDDAFQKRIDELGLRNKYKSLFKNPSKENIAAYDSLVKSDSVLSQLEKDASEWRAQKKLSDDPFKAYQRLSGEIEARDVSARMDLTPEQRAKTQPYVSQGIPQKEWITKFDNEQAQSTLKSASEEGFDTNNLIRLSKEDRNIMGKFVELVQTNRDKGNLGQTGLDADNIAKGLGIDTNLGNKAIASKFNRAIELADSLNIQPSYSIKPQPNIGEVSTTQNKGNILKSSRETVLSPDAETRTIISKLGNSPLEVEVKKRYESYIQMMKRGDLSSPIEGPNKGKNVIDEKLALKWATTDALSKQYQGQNSGQTTQQFRDIKKTILNPSQISPESKGINPQTDTVLPKGKIKTTLSETKVLKPSTKVSENPVSQLSISKKGKLNTDKLNITPEQKVAVDQIQDNVPVTVIGNKDVIKQSKLTTGSKTAMSDDQMKTRLAQQLNSRQEVVSLAKQEAKLKAQGASELELIAIKEKIIKQSRIAQQEGTLAGRQLQARNILANELATPEQKIYALLDNAGIDQKKYIKDAINVDFNDATQAVNFYRKYIPAKFSEVLTEIRYTNMLSSPLTQIVNTFSNVIQSGIVKPVEKTLTGGLDFISSKFTGKERKYFASQGIDYTKGYISALPEALKKFKNVASGKEMSLRPDLEHIPTGTKGALKWYSAPLRVLEASDQFFRTLVQSGERKSLARLNLPESELAKRAAQSADYTLFRQKFDPTGELGQGTVLKTWDKWNSAIQNLRKVPGGNWILPFIQTPTNILKQGFEYSPLGATTMIGAKHPLEQLSKAIIGSAAFLSLYGIADKGGTTWDTPSNAKEKELFYSAGLQPYSVKIGDKWVSYSKLGPLSYPLAMASALKWVEKNNPDQNLIENLQGALGEMVSFFGDQSYVSSIGDFINTMKSGYGIKNAISGEATNLVSQLIPYKSFQGWLTRMIDPVYRKPDGMVESIQAQTPGLSTGVPAYKDIYGEDSKRDLPVFNSFSPLKVSVEKPEAANLLEQQQDLNIEKAQVKKEGEKLGLGDAKKEVENGGKAQTIGNVIVYYDDGVKTLDLKKMDDISALPSDNKYNSAIKESKQYSEAAKIMDNTELTTEQQQTALDRLGIDKDKADYYRVANDSDNLKTMFVLDAVNNVKTQGGGFSDIIQLLANQRTEINGKMIASNGVLDNLVDEGIITKAQATQLKKYKFENGQLVPKTKTGTKAKKAKKISVTLRKMSAPKLSSSGKIKRISVPKKTYTAIKPRKLKVLKIA